MQPVWVLSKRDPYYEDSYVFVGLYEDKDLALADLTEQERKAFGEVVHPIINSGLERWHQYGLLKAYYYEYIVRSAVIQTRSKTH